jgi:RHS repeat-associated protein
VAYGYDRNSRLRTIVQEPLSPVDLQYDPLGRRTLLTLPNQVSTAYQYDAASRLTALLYRNALGPLGDLTYTYDAAGNRTAVGGTFARTLLPDPIPTATYDAANQQLQFGPKTMMFDPNGNLASLTDPTGTATFTWDARNRLAALSGPGVTASFQYDALGRRAAKSINGGATEYQYDVWHIMREVGGGVEAAYLRTLNIDEPLARVGEVFFLRDALGGTVGLTDAAASLVAQYRYSPFGDTQLGGLPNANPFQYTGRENDSTGLYYYRFRYLNPTLMRFLSEDPLGVLAGTNFYSYVDTVGKPPIVGTNLYEYAGGNPITRIDPFGLDWIYSQSTGQLYHLNPATDATVYVATGYSGQGAGLNNPAMQTALDFGPIPQGVWTIGPQQTHVLSSRVRLPGSMRLTAEPGTTTPGRTGGFLIHGGDMATMSSSRGCIVLPPAIRNLIANSGDTTLRVVP